MTSLETYRNFISGFIGGSPGGLLKLKYFSSNTAKLPGVDNLIPKTHLGPYTIDDVNC